jgi:molecular chaperone GrpE
VFETPNVDEDPLAGGSASPSIGDAETAGADAQGVGGLPLEPSLAAIRRLEDEVAAARDRHLRLAAEYDNYRKRAAREREELTHRSQAALAVRLLDVLDDLDRVVAGAVPAAQGDVMHQALVMIDRKLRKELEAAGLERIDPVGQPFDPSVAEAVSVIPPADPVLDHTVAATFQAGYRFKGGLIRPARVQVYSAEGHA